MVAQNGMPSAPRTSRAGSLIRLESVSKRFGGVRALRSATIEIAPGGVVHGLIGQNGSGKSTLLGILSGQLSPDEGRIYIDDELIRLRRPSDALKNGIAMVAQETYLALDLSVAENILMGRRQVRRGLGISAGYTEEKARLYLGQLGQEIDPATIVRDLRPDQRQMVEIARALSLNARLIILDEPTSSLTEDEVERLFSAMRTVTANGVSFVFVSHRMKELTTICDELTVLRDGAVVSSGAASQYDEDRIVHEMVGEVVLQREPQHRKTVQETSRPILEVRSLNIAGSIRELDLSVHQGEIVGLAGIIGAGRSELLEAIFGARAIDGGEVVIDGEPIKHSVRESVRQGIGYVPPDRKHSGAALLMSIRGNLMLAATAHRFRLMRVNRKAENSRVDRISEAMSIVASSPDAPVGSLSGGNQQKVVLGKWFATSPRLLLLDEPTRGVDIRAKQEIHDLLREAANGGAGVLVSSSENPELLQLCDRILVLFKGELKATLHAETSNEEEITRYAGGVAQ